MINMFIYQGKHLLNLWSICQQRLRNCIYIMLHITNSWYTSSQVMVNTLPIHGEQLNRPSFTHNQLVVINYPTLLYFVYIHIHHGKHDKPWHKYMQIIVKLTIWYTFHSTLRDMQPPLIAKYTHFKYTQLMTYEP